MRRLVLAFALIMLLVFAVAASRGGDLSRPAPAVQRIQPASLGPTVDPGTQLLRAQAIVEYGQALQRVEVGRYIFARMVAEFLASIPPPAPSVVVEPALPPAPAAEVHAGGSCTGFAVPDYIIQRESGGNPNAVNPSSGAYGCSQTLPSHYQPGGACAGLDMHSVDGQRQCTWILSDGGTNLAPWAL